MFSQNMLRCAFIFLYMNQVFCIKCNSYVNEPRVTKISLHGKCYYAWQEQGSYGDATSACNKPDMHVLYAETIQEIRQLMKILGLQFSKVWIGLERHTTSWVWCKGNRSFPVEQEFFVINSHASNAIAVKTRRGEFAWETSRPERKVRFVCEQETMETMPAFFKTLNKPPGAHMSLEFSGTRSSPIGYIRNGTGLIEQKDNLGLTEKVGSSGKIGWKLMSANVDDVSKVESYIFGRSKISSLQLLTSFPARSLLQCALICLNKDIGCTGIVFSKMSCQLRV